MSVAMPSMAQPTLGASSAVADSLVQSCSVALTLLPLLLFKISFSLRATEQSLLLLEDGFVGSAQ